LCTSFAKLFTKSPVQNLEHLFQLQKQMGWQLLLNEHCYLERNGEKIALIGVENWGHGRFSKYGDLNKAMEGVNTEDFTESKLNIFIFR